MTNERLKEILIAKMKILHPGAKIYDAQVSFQSVYRRKRFIKVIQIHVGAFFDYDDYRSEFDWSDNVAQAISFMDQKIYGYKKTEKLFFPKD